MSYPLSVHLVLFDAGYAPIVEGGFISSGLQLLSFSHWQLNKENIETPRVYFSLTNLGKAVYLVSSSLEYLDLS